MRNNSTLQKKIRSRLVAALALAAFNATGLIGAVQTAQATDYNHEIIYQVFTDRFFSGRSDNDDPKQSEGLFDPARKNWHAYWGGDLAGIQAKLDYIQGLGATAIWISPVFDNVNKLAVDAQGKMVAPYHGYHTRDFMRIEEHFGDPANTFADFDALIQAAHKRGIKVFVDIPFNHTSEYNHGDYGALYSSGQYRSDVENDKNKYFNHLPLIADYNNRFQLQYHTLAYLGDLNQENSYIDTYLKLAAQKLRNHGADGTRLDAAKHANWGWEQTLANMFYRQGDHLLMGEWWMTGTADPLYRDAVKFANKGGFSLFDFNLAFAIREAFKEKATGSMTKVAETISKEDKDFYNSRELLTFIDNHDMSRFLSLNDNKQALSQALALLFTCRGIPIVYYGTEQYLHDDTRGGEDPYDRPWMNSFDQKSEGYQLIQKLSKLRNGFCAFTEGDQINLYDSGDAYVFARQAGAYRAVVAINKNPGQSCSIKGLRTNLADGSYPDRLKGDKNGLNSGLQGVDLSVCNGLSDVTLPPASFSVWYNDDASGNAMTPGATPWISSLRPPVAISGSEVKIYGNGFGPGPGKLKVGTEILNANSWSDETISFTAPHKSLGPLSLTIVGDSGPTGTKATAGVSGKSPAKTEPAALSGSDSSSSAANSQLCNSVTLNVVENRLIPVRLVVASAPLNAPDDQIFITGSTTNLGLGKTTWDDAAGPMIYSDDDRKYILVVPMPAGKAVQFKLIILNKAGQVVAQESSSHTYKVPPEGCWKEDLIWQK